MTVGLTTLQESVSIGGECSLEEEVLRRCVRVLKATNLESPRVQNVSASVRAGLGVGGKVPAGESKGLSSRLNCSAAAGRMD